MNEQEWENIANERKIFLNSNGIVQWKDYGTQRQSDLKVLYSKLNKDVERMYGYAAAIMQFCERIQSAEDRAAGVKVESGEDSS